MKGRSVCMVHVSAEAVSVVMYCLPIGQWLHGQLLDGCHGEWPLLIEHTGTSYVRFQHQTLSLSSFIFIL